MLYYVVAIYSPVEDKLALSENCSLSALDTAKRMGAGYFMPFSLIRWRIHFSKNFILDKIQIQENICNI